MSVVLKILPDGTLEGRDEVRAHLLSPARRGTTRIALQGFMRLAPEPAIQSGIPEPKRTAAARPARRHDVSRLTLLEVL